MKKLQQWIKENRIFSIFLVIMFAYYIYRMFSIGMLYDELYTGRCLIYRGIVYSVVDWRLPNNHIFYSELSWLLSLLGNKTIGIRGVSVLAATVNLVLLYQLVNRLTNRKMLSNIAVFLYATCYMVIYQAAQGRGYTLSTTLLLGALLLLERICMGEQVRKRTYAGYGILLALGLYTLTSNLYYVIILSLTGGLFLVCMKNWKRLVHLIMASVFGAVVTFVLYVPTFLGMGMMTVIREVNGLSEGDAISGFGSRDMLQTILQYPMRCFTTGMESMTSNGYVISHDMKYILEQYESYVIDFIDNFFQIGSGVNMLVVICIMLSAAALWVYCIYQNRKIRKKGKHALAMEDNQRKLLMSSFVTISFVVIFLMPFIQRVVSPARTFTYMAVPFALGMILIVQQGVFLTEKNFQLNREDPILFGIAVACVMLCVCSHISNKVMQVWAVNEKETYDAIVATDAFSCEKAYIGTIFGKGQIWFETGREIEDLSEEPECVILLKEQTDPSVTEEIYQAQTTYAEVPWEWIEENMVQTYENEKVVAWTMK